MDNLSVEQMREARELILRERARVLADARITGKRLAEVVEELQLEIALRHQVSSLLVAQLIRQRAD